MMIEKDSISLKSYEIEIWLYRYTMETIGKNHSAKMEE